MTFMKTIVLLLFILLSTTIIVDAEVALTKCLTLTDFNVSLQLDDKPTTVYALGVSADATKTTKNKGQIYGHITLNKDESAIGVIVGIASIQKFTITDINGFYQLNDIPWGDYILETSTLEADTKQNPIKLQSTKHNFSFDINRKIIELESVNIVGKSNTQRLKEEGFAMNVVSMKKAKLSSLLSSELLERTAGIKLRQNGGLGSEIQYSINGLSGNSIRVFIDGIPIRNYGASFSLSSIPTSMINRIEVYKGVVPAHLSEDALGGAVNIVLNEASKTNLSTSYSYGSFNTHKWDINGNYRNEKTGFTTSGSAYYNYTDNNYKVWGDQIYIVDPESGNIDPVTATRFHDSYRSAGINTGIGFTHKKWADRFMLWLLYSDMKKDLQHGSTMEVVFGNRTAAQNTKMANLQYSKRDILNVLNVSAFASYSYGVRQVVDTTSEMYNWYGEIIRKPNGDPYLWNKGGGEAGRATLASDLENNIAGRINIGYNFLPQHEISTNIFYNHFSRDVDDPLLPTPEQLLTETRFLTKAIMGLTYETRLLDDRLKLSVFYKHYMQNVSLTDPLFIDPMDNHEYILSSQHIDKTVNENGFGGAASFQVVPNVLLLFSAEKALRLPESGELLGNTSENVLVSYDLDPESSLNLNLGVILGDFQFGQHTLSADVNFFYRDVTDMIQKSLPDRVSDATSAYENLGKVLSKGADLELNYNYRQKLFVELNVSNFNARFNLQHDEHGNEYIYYGDRLRNAPYFTLNNNVSYVTRNLFQRGSRFTVNYNLGYVHEFYRNWEVLGGSQKATVPSQLVHDIGFVYTFPSNKISLGFDAKNILDEQVFDNWALQRPGRALFGKISYNIIK